MATASPFFTPLALSQLPCRAATHAAVNACCPAICLHPLTYSHGLASPTWGSTISTVDNRKTSYDSKFDLKVKMLHLEKLETGVGWLLVLSAMCHLPELAHAS